MPAVHNESSGRPPIWGSAEHREWLAARLERSLRWRRQVEDFVALGEFAHRRFAAEVLGGRREVA